MSKIIQLFMLLALLSLGACFTPRYLAHAQDIAGSREIKLEGSNNRTLQINQVDTSKFPQVNIFATVLEGGAPVPGLAAGDFRVREDEVDQEPVSVAAQLSPLSVVVTIDTSGSMTKAMQATREAAQLFVDTLAPQDSVAVVAFNRNIQILANPGTSRDNAKQIIAGLQARGDTALFDAIHASLDLLKQRQGRKAIVLLSDGVDDDGAGHTLSKRTIDESLKLSQDLNVPVFTIGLGGELDEVTLQKVANQSGASFYKAPTSDQLSALYGKLGQQLTGQYQISYTSNLPGDGSIHNIQLTLGALRSNKPYSSPALTAQADQLKAPQVVTATAPVSPAPAKGIISMVAGTSPEDAPMINFNQRYDLTNPGDGAAKARRLFVAYSCNSGTHVSAIVDGVANPNTGSCSKLYWYTPNLREADVGVNCAPKPAIAAQWAISEESKGRCFIELREMISAKISLVAFPVDDAGSGRDAGQSEANSVPLSIGVPSTGTLHKKWDLVDLYRIELSAEVDYQIRVRPDLNSSLGVAVIDEDGNTITKKYSQNDGAGVTIDLKPKSQMQASIAINLTGRNDYARYTLVAAPKGVAAPVQPEPVIFQNRLNENH